MYNNNFINPRVFNSKKFTQEMQLNLSMTSLTHRINSNKDQYDYQNQLLQNGKVAPNKCKQFRADLDRLGIQIQNDKRQLVELGKRMAAITHDVNPKNYRPKF